jgi:hypothetical protein
MSNRVYVVTESDGSESLVEANSPASALRHVARRTMGVAVAKQQDLVRLLTAGVRVEQTTESDLQAPLEFPDAP